MKINAIAQKLLMLTRAKDWRLSFVPFIMGCVYLWLWWFQIPFTAQIIWLTFLSLITTIGFASLGYFINEFFDKKSDAKAGKINMLANLSASKQVVFFFGSILLVFIPWIWLPSTSLSWVLITLQITLFLIYSLPFPRLKEQTYLSLIIDAGYAYVVPLYLSFYTFSLISGQIDFPLWFYFLVAAVFFVGLRNIIVHQAKDVFKDLRAGLKTLPLMLGVKITIFLLYTICAIENILWVVAGMLLTYLYPVFGCYLASHVLLAIWAARKTFSGHYNPQTDELFLNRVYMYLFPAAMLCIAGLQEPLWFILFPFHILFLFPHYFIVKAFNSCKRLYYQLVSFLTVEVRKVLSAAVNYPIYYLFKAGGIDLIKENKTAADILLGRKRK